MPEETRRFVQDCTEADAGFDGLAATNPLWKITKSM